MHYHPGALLRNCWSCCQQKGKTSLGCQPTYYLLTRSSSRYAEMRRKDTLTGSHSSRSHRSKSSSVPRGERSSQTPVPEEASRESGRGLSNSCFDLTRRQIQNSFEPVSVPGETEVQHHRSSSQISTEPSISMGCITLTRLSLSESATPLVSSTPMATAEVAMWSPGGEGRGKKSRVQVAPEYRPTIRSRANFPTSESQPHLTYRTALPVLPNRFTHSTSTHFAAGSQCHTSGATPTGSTHSRATLPAAPVAYHCLTEPRRSRRKTHPAPAPPVQMSTSMHQLAKPVLEPKVSMTDPNTIHV